MTSVVDVRTTGVLLWFLVMVLMVVGAGVLEVREVDVPAVDDAGAVELGAVELGAVELGAVELGAVELKMGLETVIDEVAEVAGAELELEPQSIDPQSCGVKLYPKLHSTA